MRLRIKPLGGGMRPPSPRPPARAARTTRLAALAPLLLTAAMLLGGDRRAAAEEVDLALVLAVDVSYSMDVDEQRLQRLGYIAAITSPQVLRAIGSGMTGKIALAYVEWGGARSQTTIVDWAVVSDQASAEAFAAQLALAPQQRVFRTSISGGMLYAREMLENLPHTAMRRVIDISGDGPNNQGAPVHLTRDEVIAAGVVVNGLPLMLKRPSYGWYDIDNLDEYYERCVIGGPGSFAIPVRDINAFAEAVRMKLVLEIAGSALPRPHGDTGARDLPVRLAAAADEELCLIGERLWQRRMMDRDWD